MRYKKNAYGYFSKPEGSNRLEGISLMGRIILIRVSKKQDRRVYIAVISLRGGTRFELL
jgi:hypothetical protein